MRQTVLSCALARAQLATQDSVGVLPGELAGHVVTCAGCARYAARLARVDELVARLPVPPMRVEARQRTLALVHAEPIIIPRPQPVATPSSLTRLAHYVWETRESWQYVAGVAAVLLVGVSLYVAGTQRRQPELAGPRHELLASQVQSLARLSSAETAEQRLDVWSDVTGELVAEAERIYVGASPTDLETLDRMFTRAVREGVVRQAELLPPNLTPPQRRAKLESALQRASQLEETTRNLSERAPVQAVPTMRNLARTAAECRQTLATVARPEV